MKYLIHLNTKSESKDRDIKIEADTYSSGAGFVTFYKIDYSDGERTPLDSFRDADVESIRIIK